MARATAASINDKELRAHLEDVARDWADLAVTALAQEVSEAEIIGRENFPAAPDEETGI